MTATMHDSERASGQVVTRGLRWLTLGRLAEMGLSFLATAVLARLLAPEDFGLMAAAAVVTSLASAVFEGSFGMSVVQKREVGPDYLATSFWLAIGAAIVLLALIAATAPLVERFFGFAGVSVVLVAMSLTILLKAISSVPRALLQRQLRFRQLAVISLSSYLAGSGLLTLVLGVYGYAVWSLVAGAVLSAAIEALAMFLLSGLGWRLRPRIALIGDILRPGSSFTVAQLFNWAANTGPNSVVGHWLGAHMLGLYSRGWKLLDVAVSAVAAPMSRVMLPVFSRTQHDLARCRADFFRTLSIAVPCFGAISLMMVLHADLAVLIALGHRWADTTPVVQLLFAALLPRCAFKIAESLIVGLGQPAIVARLQAFYGALMVAGAWVGSHYGLHGVALATSLSITVVYVGYLACACRLVGGSFAELLRLHARCAVLLSPTALVHLALPRDSGSWPVPIGSVLLDAMILFAAFCLAPSHWLGSDLCALRHHLFNRRTQGVADND